MLRPRRTEPHCEAPPGGNFPQPHILAAASVKAVAPLKGLYYIPPFPKRRGAGVVDRGGLENRCTFAGTVGSNPTPSASIFQ